MIFYKGIFLQFLTYSLWAGSKLGKWYSTRCFDVSIYFKMITMIRVVTICLHTKVLHGVPWWLIRLRIRHCHCYGTGLLPSPGISTCHRHGPQKRYYIIIDYILHTRHFIPLSHLFVTRSHLISLTYFSHPSPPSPLSTAYLFSASMTLFLFSYICFFVLFFRDPT